MFGKPVSAYLKFQKVVLLILFVVGLTRLGLSMSGAPNSAVRWVSINAVVWTAAIYYGVAVYKTGFGTYRHLLPLVFFQTVAFQIVAVLGILLAMGGMNNIFAAPEYTFGASPGLHLTGHLTIGLVAPTLIHWGLSSLVMLITKAVSKSPAPQRAGA